MIDFKSKLSPETRARLEYHDRTMSEFAALDDLALANKAQLYFDNCERPRFEKGSPVYDSVMYYVIIPELIKRLRKVIK